MTIYDIAAYFLTLVAIALAPGPAFLLLMVRAASRDTLGAAFCGAGYASGGVAIITAVCFGLDEFLEAESGFFIYGKYVMLAYILYLARGIWQGGIDSDSVRTAKSKNLFFSYGEGIMACAISPYMMILFPLTLPNILDTATLSGDTVTLIAVITFLALSIGSGIVILFTSQLKRIARSPQYIAIINRSLAAVLACAGGYIALT